MTWIVFPRKFSGELVWTGAASSLSAGFSVFFSYPPFWQKKPPPFLRLPFPPLFRGQRAPRSSPLFSFPLRPGVLLFFLGGREVPLAPCLLSFSRLLGCPAGRHDEMPAISLFSPFFISASFPPSYPLRAPRKSRRSFSFSPPRWMPSIADNGMPSLLSFSRRRFFSPPFLLLPRNRLTA